MFDHLKYDHLIEETLERVEGDGQRFYRDSEGNMYKSVTTWLGKFNGESIEQWRKAVGEEEAKRVGRLAATKGTNIHLACEKFLNNESDYKKHLWYDELGDWKYLEPALKKHVNHVVCQEFRLKSKKLKLAGTVDCVAKVDGVLSIVDFKTSKKEKTKEDIYTYWLQTALYAIMMYEMYQIKIDQLCIIMVVNQSHVLVYKEPSVIWMKKVIQLLKEEENA